MKSAAMILLRIDQIPRRSTAGNDVQRDIWTRRPH